MKRKNPPPSYRMTDGLNKPINFYIMINKKLVKQVSTIQRYKK
nr:hypothetical protein DLTAUQXX_DLTAUQXX_CDS_0046 [uncultured phage]CAI9750141.1 hypothetical protein LUIDIZRK_LUIDIZRK_CDS_0046 [uncultured phage]